MKDDDKALIERLRYHRLTNPDGLAAADRLETLLAERDFLLARSGHAGTASFGNERWTGMSSNALVTVAFGGEDRRLPSDSSDLAACYRTVMRLPPHLLSESIFDQLERGESVIAEREPDGLTWARGATGWPGLAALRSLAKGD